MGVVATCRRTPRLQRCFNDDTTEMSHQGLHSPDNLHPIGKFFVESFFFDVVGVSHTSTQSGCRTATSTGLEGAGRGS